ncbi:MAG: 16S rRNA (uracil(1498)-N(3))-methyltransferase [Syntrophobacteraceae bacterium]|jgi:16S rRNA (uracil1498-N3)-methyltransferase|nr:16S rRNA (uracil(1498)-N(3))-methyltransferase [Syntrophobacteraceae bacterium]
MSRKCFYIGPIDERVEILTIQGNAAHHMSRVLRLGVGERVELRDGLGHSWSGRIEAVSKGAVSVRVLEEISLGTESPLFLTLGMALARSDRMDLVVRQGTELGVDRFAFFPAARSQYRLSGQEAGRRLDRWSRISREALCQCRRTVLPEIVLHGSLDAFLEAVRISGGPGEERLKVLALEGRMGRSLKELHGGHPECSEMVAATGPEGGWREEEVSRLEREGFLSVHLGPRIMRFETAALAVLVGAQLLWGDLR